MSSTRSSSVTQTVSCTSSVTPSSSGTPTGTSTASVTHTLTSATVSPTPSFYLPPCNATNLTTLAALFPRIFNFSVGYETVRDEGFNHTLLTTDLAPELVYIIPLLLRNPLLLAHPAYVPTDPFTPPNPDGFVRYASVAANVSFVNYTTVSVVMAPLPGYAVDTSEDAQLRAPFAAVVYCNGSDPNPPWLAVPPTIPIVAVHVVGPPPNNAIQTSQLVTSPGCRGGRGGVVRCRRGPQ